MKLIRVAQVEPLDGHRLRVQFANGETRGRRCGAPAGETSVILTVTAPQIRSLDPEEVLQARKRG